MPTATANHRRSAAGQETKSEDHRVRVGRERRERMRKHLFSSVLHVCSIEAMRAPAVIDDVVRHAKVSRGTFYKYFESVDQAISELGSDMADEMTAGIASVYDVLADPVMRTATGFQLFLLRAMLEPTWGAFIARIGVLREEDLFTKKIRADIALGIETGDYSVTDIVCASDLLMGAKVEAILRINRKGQALDYIKTMTVMVLNSFGATPTKAKKCVDRSFDRLILEAPGKLHWWRDLVVSSG